MEEVKGDVQKYKELRQLLTEYQLIVDSTEQPIVRPIDYELQKDYYSGKKRWKNQFIVLPQGQDIVDVTVGEVGKQVTLIFREHQNKFGESQKF